MLQTRLWTGSCCSTAKEAGDGYGRWRSRAYGLATAARDGRHGRGCSQAYGLATAARDGWRGRVCSRAYGLATAARDGWHNTRAVGAAVRARARARRGVAVGRVYGHVQQPGGKERGDSII